MRDEPDEIVAAHTAFFDVGADVAITASYHASYAGFARVGIDEEQATRLIALSVQLARRAQPADRQTFVAGSVGLYGVVWANGTEYTGDYGRATDDEVADEQGRRIRALVDAGAELLAIETIPNGREAMILGELLTEQPGVEAWVTFCCRDGHHLSDGTPIADAVRAVTRTGRVTAVGVNCTPPQHVESLLTDARTVTDLPLVAYPNWGRVWDGATYEWVDGTGVVEFSPDLLDRWSAAGARAIGGCCGIGPKGIAGVSAWARGARVRRRTALSDAANRIALRAFDIVESPVPGFIEKAQWTAGPSILERRHDADATPFAVIRIAHAAGLAHLASKLGYATRIAEFEQLAAPDYNTHLETFLKEVANREALLQAAAGEGEVSAAWLATIVATARVLTRAADRHLLSPDDSQLLEPTALGRAAHRNLRARELDVQMQGTTANEALKEISTAELADCWDFGYYLRACEMSLPAGARAALMGSPDHATSPRPPR